MFFPMKKIILLLLLLPVFGFSQVDLVKWNGMTSGNSPVPTNVPTLLVQGVDASNVTGTQYSLEWDGFAGKKWPVGNNIAADKYIQLSISAKPGSNLNLSSLKFCYNTFHAGDGARKFQVRYSKNINFPSNGTLLLDVTNPVIAANKNVSVNFPTGTTVSENETLYIRFYAYDRANQWYDGAPFFLTHAHTSSNGTYYVPTIAGTVAATVPACTPAGNQTAFGTDKWIGYVYNNASDVTNPPANAFNSSNYKGYININTDTFDNDLGTNSISGPNVCGSYADFFAVRYKMKKTFPAGTYIFKVGGDDGYRLSVNGVNVIDKFVLQSYGTTESAPVTLSGATELILEYYEDQTFSRVSFNYTYTPCVALTAPTGIVKSATTVCTTGDSVLLTAQGGTPAGTAYQWGTGAVAGTNPIANENGASITVSPTATTTYWVRRFSNDACSTYSSITTIAVTPTDRNVSGNGEWIGYVYSNYTNNATTPAVNDANYRGYVTENAIFDREVASGSPFRGRETYLCNAPTERYFVRYKMTLNLPAGKYNFTVGGDDGYRLSIDGTAVAAINNWGEHGYATNSTSVTFNTATTHTFILEYFNGPNLAHVSFNYNKVEGDPTEFGNNVWNVYGYNEENINIDALSASYAGYYTDPAIGIFSQDRWTNTLSPSAAIAVPATGATGWIGGPVRNDNFTVVHKRKGFPCGLYELKMERLDDQARVFLDGVQIYDQSAATTTLDAVIGTYKLNADSKIEVRLREGGGAAYLKLAITDKPAVYNNGSWSNTPANTNITINSDLALTDDLTVCSCTVKAGKKLTINANATLNVLTNVVVENTGSILVKNTGSLVQMRDDATFTGESNSFTMERNTTPMINYDFSYWGSPVATQNLKTFSPNTLADKYYSYNGASWVIENPVTTSMTAGRGYIVRAPQGWANTITNGGVSSYNTTQPNGTFEGGVFQGVFTGKANAGTITVPLMGNVGVNNLIGNPYASPISVDEFIKGNSGKIDGTFYFWTHKTRVSQTPNQNGTYPYNNQDYAVYNKTGGVATSPIEKKPDGIIASGQGFFVRTIGTGNVVFKNSMRVSGINKNKDFYRSGETTVENNRFWLSMGNVDGLYSEFLVGYNDDATNDFDVDFDGITTSTGNVMLYTTVNSNKLAIQGRQAPFAQSDVVPVGYKAAAAGQYTISINKKEGLFENGQAIYIYDYVTNEHHDLTAGDFTFTSAAGTFDTRFEVRFADRTLGVETPVASNSDVIVYKNGNQIAAKATNFTIEDMQVYDITGKILFSKKGINNNEFSTASLNVANQVVVVKVTLDGGQTISKKVIMN